jgi:hypothetical protein
LNAPLPFQQDLKVVNLNLKVQCVAQVNAKY